MNWFKYMPGIQKIPVILMLVIPAQVYSQTLLTEADSIVMSLSGKPDSLQVTTLISVCEDLKDNHPEKAFEYGQQAVDLAIQISDPLLTGRAYLAVAEIYTLWSQYDKSLEYLLLSLDAFERAENNRYIAISCNAIGVVYMSAGEYEQASAYYMRARNLNTLLREHREIAKNLINLGTNYIYQDSVQKGLSFYLVSQLIVDSLGMTEEKIELLNALGQGYNKDGDYENALHSHYEALELLKENPNEYAEAATLSDIATSYNDIGNYPAVITYAGQAIEMARENHFNQIRVAASKLLSDAYAAQNDYRQSYAYFTEFKNISDSVFQATKAQDLLKIQARYDLDKKEQEIESLRLQNYQNQRANQTKSIIIVAFASLLAILATLIYFLVTLNRKRNVLNVQLAKQGQELEILNDQKDRFFSFVAHNLKNPFNTIMGFSELMQGCTDKKDLVKAGQYAGLIHNLSTHVQKVLSNLLEWSRLQRRSFEFKPEVLELNSLVKDVLEMNNKEAARKDLHISLSSFENVFTVADRTMITTVMQNLISNAINFTPPSGQITVQCKKNDMYAEVTVADEGIGIEEEDIPRLFEYDILKTKIGSGQNKGAGLGLILSREMVQRNGGDIRVKSTPGKGSEFSFTLPLSEVNGHETEDQDSSFNEAGLILDELITSERTPSPQAVTDIQQKVAPSFREVSEVLSLENVDRFAETLSVTGEKHGMELLIRYGSALKKLLHQHRIDMLIGIIPRFKDYLEKIYHA